MRLPRSCSWLKEWRFIWLVQGEPKQITSSDCADRNNMLHWEPYLREPFSASKNSFVFYSLYSLEEGVSVSWVSFPLLGRGFCCTLYFWSLAFLTFFPRKNNLVIRMPIKIFHISECSSHHRYSHAWFLLFSNIKIMTDLSF